MTAASTAALVTDLAKGFALSEFYPLKHPTLVHALHRLETALLGHGTELHVDVSPAGLTVGLDPVARRSTHAARLAARLAEHGVRAFALRNDTGAESLGRFLSAVTLPPRVAAAAGGMVAVLTAAGTPGISVNGFRIPAPAQEDAPPSQDFVPSRPEDFGITMWTAQDIYNEVRESAQRVEAEDLAELRRVLREGNESERLESLQRMEMVAQWTLAQGMMDNSVALVDDLRRDAEHLQGKNPAIRGHVMLAIHRLAVREVVDELVARLGRARSEEDRTGMRSTLLHVGADTVTPLVRALTGASDVGARRAYRDALVALDYVGVPLLEEMVGDERWFVVRNMVGILGEIRSADAIDHFTRTVRHEDARVRRETILALTKLGTEDAVPLLVRGLADAEPGLRSAAALGLGLGKSHAAVAPLLSQLKTETEPEALVEIVRALGRIGDPRAVPALADRAGGGNWLSLSRHPTPLRVEAVRALGEIGGEPARAVLQRLLRDRTAEVRDAAAKAVR
ncbi:MAG: HEAT-like repeat-containing protein [Gemmatimonadetes bacterium]|nr:HEAT-like repeat-containing protein [Gemmatimonadota bacterium]